MYTSITIEMVGTDNTTEENILDSCMRKLLLTMLQIKKKFYNIMMKRYLVMFAHFFPDYFSVFRLH